MDYQDFKAPNLKNANINDLNIWTVIFKNLSEYVYNKKLASSWRGIDTQFEKMHERVAETYRQKLPPEIRATI